MQVLTIPSAYLAPLRAGIHRRRLAMLLDAVTTMVSRPRLTLTDIDRRSQGSASLRHEIKRSIGFWATAAGRRMRGRTMMRRSPRSPSPRWPPSCSG
ncbi:hypothetical protein [Accumulibacter sp.]|uniref:hypothetical protein n=1 Tax=Accumulibacter sp. TaxID=2053492 RepID=UPI0025FD0EF9|nr:hypothetical protein [Accumulibacter sp.]MCM8624865.1 hypothetical protein [Accumulibacter sp.]